jgi:hypothetical protein
VLGERRARSSDESIQPEGRRLIRHRSDRTGGFSAPQAPHTAASQQE